MKRKLSRAVVGAAAVVVLAGTAVAGALGVAIPVVGPRDGALASFGPINQFGYPTSYKDTKGVRLEGCYTPDPLCGVLPSANYNPALPLVVGATPAASNFPDEFFYQLSSAVVDPLGDGNKLLVETNLEAAFATGPPIAGDQITFTRIRIKDVNVPDGVTWRITHPYGVDEVTGAGGRGVFVTEDIGVAPGVFSGALNGRVGPFLKWDPAQAPAAPAGYIGDPGVLHKVVGSPYGTNFIKVERVNADGSTTLIKQFDDQFSLQGRLAVNSGVDIDKAVYSTDSGGKSFVDVYASSDAGQGIQVSANATLGTPTIPMVAQDGRYFAHIAVVTPGLVPPTASVEVVNVGDKPPAKKTAVLKDEAVITSAIYDSTAQSLVVKATSSDLSTTPPALTLQGLGLGGSTLLVGGTATVPALVAPPATVKVTSSRGGLDTSTLVVSGAGFVPAAPVAQFTVTPVSPQVGQPVTLNGSASTGDITTWAWTVDGGNAGITGSNTPTVTWTPTTAGPHTIGLVVSGPGGVSVQATQIITVVAAAPVTANAGTPITATRGTVVQLAGGATGQRSVAWTQVSGPTVQLSNAAIVNPTFTYPLMALPVGPIGNLNTAYSLTGLNNPIVLRLTATSTNGLATATNTVTITPTAETITPLTVRYRTSGLWRITGTTNLLRGQTIAMVLGSTEKGAYIGSASVDAAGAFSFRGGITPRPGTVRTVTLVSQTGGRLLGTTLLVTP